MSKQYPHISVLLKEFLDFFKEKKIVNFIDATIGMGGHAEALLEAHPEVEKFIGLDRDEHALEIAAKRLDRFKKKVVLIHSSFHHVDSTIEGRLEGGVDGIFFDLGVSSLQLDTAERGFSLYRGGPLDMRMDHSSSLTAHVVINTYSEEKLGRIFRDYGEERRWRQAARRIVEARRKKPIETTDELTEVLKTTLIWGGRKSKSLHPMTLLFQALRIEVNDELHAIEEGVPKAFSLLAKEGRLGVIAFHSLEDRIVKHLFRKWAIEKRALILTKKPLTAQMEEKRHNPRARSAKMRFIEKIA